MSNRDLINELLHLDSFNSAVTEKAAAALEAHEWQPIEFAQITATEIPPLDGTEILFILKNDVSGRCIKQVLYSEDDVWRVSGDGAEADLKNWTATHWKHIQPPGDE